MRFSALVGDRRFYRRVLTVAFPIMIQNGVTTLVNLLDNVMVGRLGTEAMSGVSIVNQFVFVFNLLIFGAVSAAGIFTAQFHGSGDVEGVKYSLRFKLILNTLAALLSVSVFALFSEELIRLFLHTGSAEIDPVATLSYGKQYLFAMLLGLIPYAISQACASTLRETEVSVPPMVASVIAVFTNLVLNYLLIFGKLGLPALGVVGAAVATVISRFAELLFLLIWMRTHRDRCPYTVGAFRSLHIPKALFLGIAVKGLPLMMNELFWSLAITLRNQSYSTRGLDVVAAQNILITLFNFVSVVYMAVGASISILVGNELGAGKVEEAKKTASKMIAFASAFGLLLGGIMIAVSRLFPLLYDTTDSVRDLAAYMIVAVAVAMPFSACAHASYFTIRTGGRVFATMLLDSVYMWTVAAPMAFLLARYTGLSIHALFAICQSAEVIKAVFSLILLKRVAWARRLVGDGEAKMA